MRIHKFLNRLTLLNSLFGFYKQIVNSTNVAFMEMLNICFYLSDFLHDIKTIWHMICVVTGYTESIILKHGKYNVKIICLLFQMIISGNVIFLMP